MIMLGGKWCKVRVYSNDLVVLKACAFDVVHDNHNCRALGSQHPAYRSLSKAHCLCTQAMREWIGGKEQWNV